MSCHNIVDLAILRQAGLQIILGYLASTSQASLIVYGVCMLKHVRVCNSILVSAAPCQHVRQNHIWSISDAITGGGLTETIRGDFQNPVNATTKLYITKKIFS